MAHHYIIVVHGIGEQRKNETVLSVINRFAEVRRPLPFSPPSSILTLGRATSQTGKDYRTVPCRFPVQPFNFTPWLEFEGIPRNPAPGTVPSEFIGQTSTSGENLRFVDLCWADLLQDDWPEVGQPVDAWAQGLVGRLQKVQKAHPFFKNERGENGPLPVWIPKTLEELAETLIWTRRAMSFRFKNFEDLIFNQFLGDVQLYGEFTRIRGKAVRRFHRLMARIELEHAKQFPHEKPTYTVIAHSLGTIMSFDALLYAHVRPEIRKQPPNRFGPNLPFPGHFQESQHETRDFEGKIQELESLRQTRPLSSGEEFELETARINISYHDTSWAERVKSFVTLGSPIDKFLVMWWLNYEYVQRPNDWMLSDPEWIQIPDGKHSLKQERRNKISHYNYCDEQDPVGHELDIARNTPAYQAIFDSKEDRVFNRYPLPGVAHVGYWDDQELFRRISDYAVDNPGAIPPGTGFKWFDPDTYRDVLRIHYKLIPWAVVLLDYLVFTWVLYSTSLHQTILAAVLTLFMWYMGRKVIDLMIYWRQILRNKFQVHLDHNPAKSKALFQDKITMGRRFRVWVTAIPLLNAFLASLGLSVVLDQAYIHSKPTDLNMFEGTHFLKQIYLFAGLLGVLGILLWWLWLKKPTDVEESEILKGEPFWRANKWVVLLWVVMGLLTWVDYKTRLGLWLWELLESAFNWLDFLETAWLPHIWINLTVFLVVATTVFGYQAVRFWLAKEELKQH